MNDQVGYEAPNLEVLGTLYELTQNGSTNVALDSRGKAPGNVDEISL